MKLPGKSTISVHTGTVADDENQGLVSPIYPSTSYGYLDTEQLSYPRYFNTPNQKAVSKKIAALENAEDCIITSSGMAAISTILFSVLKSGDHAIFQSGLYGGTHHAVVNEFEKFNIEYTFVDRLNHDTLSSAVRSNTRLVYFETPSNPLLDIVDLKDVAAAAKTLGLITIVDNTFASPINQNPISFGIDAVIHSGTKYLGGHSDLSCGAIISSEEMIKKCWQSAIHFGGNLNPLSIYLLERSLKTLAIRVREQNKNAAAIASYLNDHSLVKKVYYPGLNDHSNYQIAKDQMKGFGGMLAFELDAPEKEIIEFSKNLKVITSAMSLGGVETIMTSPALTSHAKMDPEDRLRLGITDSLLRMSVGIEDETDLINDLEGALKRLKVLV